ncbi:hypothetical protein AB0I00_30750 [Streptomyces sp. NPDC050803]|uniref:hypothetical protein n=1 Tax=unclassified Streptomyces TaxID=2593676 RepID=UPI00344AF295
MKHHIGIRATTALLCATTAIITGCGPGGAGTGAKDTAPATESTTEPKHPFDTMTPQQIDNQARQALKDATSMRWTGRFNSDGRQMDVDLAMDIHGSCNGTIDADSMGTMHIIRKGPLVHVKAEEDFWRASFSRGMTAEQTEEMVTLFTGRWVKPPKMMSQVLGRMCEGFDAQIETLSLVSDSNPTREADTTVNGRPVAVLAERTPTETTTVYVAKKGKPYALRISVTGGNEPIDVTITDHGKPVDTTPPPPDQVLDPTKLR